MSMLKAFGAGPRSDEGEKPFWISYADLMTALMILFLVIMVAALAAITKQAEELTKRQQKVDEPVPLVKEKIPEVVKNDARFQEIHEICSQISDKAAEMNPNVKVDCRLNRINFGEVGRFKTDEYRMNADGETALAQIVPIILETANSPKGRKWLKQITIEGYTDTDGSYLYNLNLSLKRSEWVMCTLLRNDTSSTKFSPEQRKQIKKLFLAGGVAFNNVRDSKDASRRVELKMQFYGEASEYKASTDYELKFDDSSKERCML